MITLTLTNDPQGMAYTGPMHAAAEALAATLSEGEKVTDAMVAASPLLQAGANEYARLYVGGFSYMLDMSHQANKAAHSTQKCKPLSVPQMRGVLNCLVAEGKRGAAKAAAAAEEAAAVVTTTTEVLLPSGDTMLVHETKAALAPVHDGTYTVVGASEADYVTLKLKTQPMDSSFAPGKQVAYYLTGPDNETSYKGFAFVAAARKVCVWKAFMGNTQLVQALKVILEAEDVKEFGYQYALQSGNCCICGHKLTVPASIHNGMGPICAAKY